MLRDAGRVVIASGLAAALTAAGTGNLALVIAAASADGSGLAPWLQGGGSAAAVGGLVYVARMIVKGDLVPRAVADRENETAGAIRVSAERENKLQELTGESLAREHALATIGGESVRALADVNAELRWWRDQRMRGQTTSLPRGEAPLRETSIRRQTEDARRLGIDEERDREDEERRTDYDR